MSSLRRLNPLLRPARRWMNEAIRLPSMSSLRLVHGLSLFHLKNQRLRLDSRPLRSPIRIAVQASSLGCAHCSRSQVRPPILARCETGGWWQLESHAQTSISPNVALHSLPEKGRIDHTSANTGCRYLLRAASFPTFPILALSPCSNSIVLVLHKLDCSLSASPTQ